MLIGLSCRYIWKCRMGFTRSNRTRRLISFRTDLTSCCFSLSWVAGGECRGRPSDTFEEVHRSGGLMACWLAFYCFTVWPCEFLTLLYISWHYVVVSCPNSVFSANTQTPTNVHIVHVAAVLELELKRLDQLHFSLLRPSESLRTTALVIITLDTFQNAHSAYSTDITITIRELRWAPRKYIYSRQASTCCHTFFLTSVKRFFNILPTVSFLGQLLQIIQYTWAGYIYVGSRQYLRSKPFFISFVGKAE